MIEYLIYYLHRRNEILITISMILLKCINKDEKILEIKDISKKFQILI